jgi:hypothetical protein
MALNLQERSRKFVVNECLIQTASADVLRGTRLETCSTGRIGTSEHSESAGVTYMNPRRQDPIFCRFAIGMEGQQR